MKRSAILAGILALGFCVPLHAQTPEIETSSTRSLDSRLLHADLPLSFAASKLDETWQFVSINAASSEKKQPPIDSIPAAIDRALHVAPNVYLTQWQTIQSGAQSFLIAYRAEPLISSEEIRASISSISKPQFWQTRNDFMQYLKAQTDARPLKLTLLNLQNVGKFSDIENYDVAERNAALSIYIAMSGFREIINKLDFQSQSNLKYLATAVLQYAQEHDEKLPPLQNMEVFKKAIFPYVRDNAVFVQSSAKKHYVTNGAMANKGYANIQFASQIALLYEAQFGSDGKRAVAFADGHVKRVSESEWTKIKKFSGIK